jgi:hypothetical protein
LVTIIRVSGRSKRLNAVSDGSRPAASSASQELTAAPHHAAIAASGW